MKGFIYLLEISIALILMLVVLGTISSYRVKESWERPDLVGIGDNILKVIKDEDFADILNNNLSKIESLLPSNIGFGLKVKGAPKNNITVGCVGVDMQEITKCSQFMSNVLNCPPDDCPTYINNYYINFSLSGVFDGSISSTENDVIVFINYTDYGSKKTDIIDYLNKGGVVIGINATLDNSNTDFNEIFGLSPVGSSDGNFYFTTYDPLEDEIERYFLGLGFNIKTNETVDSKKWGNWYIWEESRKVNITASKTVDIENKTIDEGFIRNIPEGGTFNLKNTDDNEFYTFKVKRVFWDKYVIIQLINTSFIFKDFSETNDVTGNVNIIKASNEAEMTSNNSAIWISDFPESDEYKTLVKAAIASRVKEWFVKEPDLNQEYVTVSSFFPLCCDMPETAELVLYLWYKI